MSKNIKEAKPKKKLPSKEISRLGFIFMFSGNIAVAIYLGILVTNPDIAQYVLAGFSTVSAIYFLIKAIK